MSPGPEKDAGDGVIIFDVGGKTFKVLGHTVLSRPSTLLASLVEDIGTNREQPIFVDANAERFSHILDWYRYGEMFVPKNYPIDAVLRDARFFLLPDEVMINGNRFWIQARTPEKPKVPAESVRESLSASITAAWPTFEQYVEDLVAKVQEHYLALAASAAHPRPLPDGFGDNGEIYARGHEDAQGCMKSQLTGQVFRPCEFILSERGAQYSRFCGLDAWVHWLDQVNVCNKERLWVLIKELERRGFDCELLPHDSCGSLQGCKLRVGLCLGDEVQKARTYAAQLTDALSGVVFVQE